MGVTHGRAFGPREDELIKNLWAQGYSAGQISKLLTNGRTRNAIIGRLWRLGVNKSDRHTDMLKPRKAPKVVAKKPVAPPAPVEPPKVEARAPAPPPPPKPVGSAKVKGYPYAKPWTQRLNDECAYPVRHDRENETISCCVKVSGENRYCDAHMKRMYVIMTRDQRRIRLPRAAYVG